MEDKFTELTPEEIFFGNKQTEDNKFRPLTRKEMFFGIESKELKLSYALGEVVGLLRGIEMTCHDKMLKYEIQKAIDKIENLKNGGDTEV